MTLMANNSNENLSHQFQFSSSLILFDSQKKDLVYPFVLGSWNGLINTACIVPEWGLRFIASEGVYADRIKEIKRYGFQNDNPDLNMQRFQKLAPFKDFTFDIGSEGIESLQVLTTLSQKRVFKGADEFHFSLKSGKKNIKQDSSITSLHQIWQFVSDHQAKISQVFRPYIDNCITNEDLAERLESKLLKSKNFHLLFFDEKLWKDYGKTLKISNTNTKKEEDYQLDPKKILSGLLERNFKFNSKVYIKRGKSKETEEVYLKRYLFSLPLEYKDSYYRYKRGLWFQVANDRFDIIRTNLRKYKIPQSKLALPEYTDELLESQEGKYQEDKYNKAACTYMSKEHLAILLDQKNISLKRGHDKFEFADLLLAKNDHVYLLHVKRASAKQLSHLREQMERCAEYLGSTQDRSSCNNILKSGTTDDDDFEEWKNDFFRKGVLAEKIRGKTTIVLVYINDNNKDFLFGNQDLWGLDRTRQIIEQKYHLNFKICIVNENKDNQKDAFGFINGTVSETYEDENKVDSLKNELEEYAISNGFTFKSGQKLGLINRSKLASNLSTTAYFLSKFLDKNEEYDRIRSCLSNKNPKEESATSDKAKENSDVTKKSLKTVKNEIGPPKIEGWELKDVLGDGNCFYHAVIDQMERTSHAFLQDVPDSSTPHDVLRGRVQGNDFKDEEWADEQQITEFVKLLDVILAIVDTRTPKAGYTYHYMNQDNIVISHGITPDHPISELPTGKWTIKLAATGNHFLSVESQP